MADVDLASSRYITHRFARHTHDTYAIGLILDGVEEWWHDGTVQRAGAGQLPLVNPGTVHTGHAGVPDGWTYRMLYPSVPAVADVAAELGMPAGTPWFPAPTVEDPDTARLLLAAHRAAEAGDPLAATSLTRRLLGRMLRRFGGPAPSGRRGHRPPAAGRRAAERACAILHERLADAPTLGELAAETGTGQFALLRAFRSRYGLPPHTYLTQVRVDRARLLLSAGGAPADVAVGLGFADQAHLSRHFKRIVGVSPGAYRRGRRIVQEPAPVESLRWAGDHSPSTGPR